MLAVGSLDPGIGHFAPVELVHFDASDDLGYYDPVGYQLTTAEGLGLTLDQRFGVQRITEPNGHTVTFGPGGLVHSASPSVVFTRDALGRITTITDPLGHTLTYTYDGAGDLVAVTDQEGHTTRYTCDATHKLVAIVAPRGVTVARTLYDDADRWTQFSFWLNMDSRELREQKLQQCSQQGFATSPHVVHKFKEAQV